MSGSLSGGWLYLVDEHGDPPYVTHARVDCRAVRPGGDLRPVLVSYGTPPPPESEWESCELCGGARPVGRGVDGIPGQADVYEILAAMEPPAA